LLIVVLPAEGFQLKRISSKAYEHHAERFRDTFKELAESIEDTGQQLSDWLRKTRSDL
jgi:hypothetical protein